MPTESLTELPIEALIALLQAEGTKAQYAELIRRYEWALLGSCRSWLQDREAARDAAAETWLRVLERLPTTRVDHFPSWLYHIGLSVCQDRLREQRRESDLEEEFYTLLSHTPEARIDFTTPERLLTENVWEPDERLAEALTQLSDKQQRCVRLFFFERKSYRQIAALTQYTEQQVRSALQNARLRLRRMLVDE